MISYTLLNIDDQGNAVILVDIDGKQFKQELCNIPIDDIEACKAKLASYASEYDSKITEQEKPKVSPVSVNSLIGVKQTLK